MLVPAEKLSSRYVPLQRLTPADTQQMYAVFSQYYQNTTQQTFLDDLSRKSGVILARTRKSKRIVGFSTLTHFDINVGGKRARGLFSGDTIVEPAYWGSRCLHVAFYAQLIRARLRHPLTPLYWLLISKGYKTYLLLTRNFYAYYPDRNTPDSPLKQVVAAYSQQLFPKAFDPQRMLLDFGEGAQHLKEEVASITPELCEQDADIAYFEQRNPSWRRGTELPCAGEVSYSALLRYCSRLALKLLRRNLNWRAATTAAQPSAQASVIQDGSAELSQ
ncbi:hypothetical protein OU800_20500 [Pseudomonas sp. GOM7]|uniref:hypothetical protein n=1 Tax=unclassified Pseudomonas TaxID=196821 RepID=UPI00227A7494|nr:MULTISPECIES: hypothetical protein [unclassified Pseudomonas]WAJ36959.1 hypothetical protein OU800_20500 [Pseudomonas sp. GOM7]